MLVTCLSLVVQAQTADTVKRKFSPTGLRIGTDVLSIIRSYTGSNFDGWEINADVDLYRYYVAAEYGHWERHLNIPSGNYENSGNYFRLGTDINFLIKDPDRNMFFLGLRYGQSSFSEQLNYEAYDSNFGTYQRSLTNSGMTGRWGELTTGLRVKISGGFWMGYTARLKFAPSIHGTGGFATYEIPGYGITSRKNAWAFNYQLFWRIPLHKEPVKTKL